MSHFGEAHLHLRKHFVGRWRHQADDEVAGGVVLFKQGKASEHLLRSANRLLSGTSPRAHAITNSSSMDDIIAHIGLAFEGWRMVVVVVANELEGDGERMG